MDRNGSAFSLQFGTVTLIPEERLLLKDGRPVPLTPKAFDLLAVLAASPGRLLTKEQLMEAVWPDTAVEESNLTYHVFAIRKALGENADSDRCIETVPKRGYRFVAPVVRVEADSGRVLPHASARHEEIPAGGTSTRHGGGTLRPWLGLVAGLVIGALLAWALSHFHTPAVPTGSVHFQEPVTGRLAATGMFSVSPDGRHLLFGAEGADGVLQLWVRTMSALQPIPLPGTEVFTIIPPAVWSPDSRFVAFEQSGVLKKVGMDGGTPQSVCALPATAVGGSWNRNGDILVGNAAGGLVRCPASGGHATIVTVPDESAQERHVFPSFLPDGQHFVYLRISRTTPEASGIYAGMLGAASLRAGDRLVTTGFGAAFVAAAGAGPGSLVFARDGALFAQRFDERRLEVIGDPVRFAGPVGSFLDGAFFSVSATTLVYRAPDPDFQLEVDSPSRTGAGA